MRSMTKGLAGMTLHPTLETAMKRNRQNSGSWSSQQLPPSRVRLGIQEIDGDEEELTQPEGGESREGSQELPEPPRDSSPDPDDWLDEQEQAYGSGPSYTPISPGAPGSVTPGTRMVPIYSGDNSTPLWNPHSPPSGIVDEILPAWVSPYGTNAPQQVTGPLPNWRQIVPDPSKIYEMLAALPPSTQQSLVTLFGGLMAAQPNQQLPTIALVNPTKSQDDAAQYEWAWWSVLQPNLGFLPSHRYPRFATQVDVARNYPYPHVTFTKSCYMKVLVGGNYPKPAFVTVSCYAVADHQKVYGDVFLDTHGKYGQKERVDTITYGVEPDGIVNMHFHCVLDHKGNNGLRDSIKPRFYFRVELKGVPQVYADTDVFQIYARGGGTTAKQVSDYVEQLRMKQLVLQQGLAQPALPTYQQGGDPFDLEGEDD